MEYDEVWDEKEKLAKKISFDDMEEKKYKLQNSISPIAEDVDLFQNGENFDSENNDDDIEKLSDEGRETDAVETRNTHEKQYHNSDLPHDYEDVVMKMTMIAIMIATMPVKMKQKK